MRRLFLFSLLACMASIVKAADPVLVDGLYFQISNGTASVTKSTADNPYTGVIVIPGQIEVDENTYTVTAVGNDAFNPSLTPSVKFSEEIAPNNHKR